MALKGEAKRAYQREYMRRRRAADAEQEPRVEGAANTFEVAFLMRIDAAKGLLRNLNWLVDTRPSSMTQQLAAKASAIAAAWNDWALRADPRPKPEAEDTAALKARIAELEARNDERAFQTSERGNRGSITLAHRS